MEQFISGLPEYLKIAAEFLGVLVVFATVVARITPTKSDDETVSKISSVILKVISYLPTIGINPQTKKLQEAYDELKNK